MLDTLYEILGITNVTYMQETVCLITLCVLIFFGSLCILSALLSFFTSIFRFER